MADAVPVTPAPPPSPPPPTPSDAGPWYNGTDSDTVGFWENKGWGKDNPKDLAVNMTKSYREMEKHFGTPADQLLRMPKPDADPKDIKAFWQRLGAPSNPTEYDFSSIKFNGQEVEPGLIAAMRDMMAEASVPKDKAELLAARFVKKLENDDLNEKTMKAAAFAEEEKALAKSWGPNFDFNHLKAIEGARRAGVSKEGVEALEGKIGYAAVMELFRKIGAGTSEHQWVDTGVKGPGGINGVPVTREGAAARVEELINDKAWSKRWTEGDRQAREEYAALRAITDGNE